MRRPTQSFCQVKHIWRCKSKLGRAGPGQSHQNHNAPFATEMLKIQGLLVRRSLKMVCKFRTKYRIVPKDHQCCGENSRCQRNFNLMRLPCARRQGNANMYSCRKLLGLSGTGRRATARGSTPSVPHINGGAGFAIGDFEQCQVVNDNNRRTLPHRTSLVGRAPWLAPYG